MGSPGDVDELRQALSGTIAGDKERRVESQMPERRLRRGRSWF
jgi:hypothetical protein